MIFLNFKEPSKYNVLRMECAANISLKNTIVMIISIIAAHAVFGTGPIYVFFFKNARATPLESYLLFIHDDTGSGFPLNLIPQCVVTFCEIMG